MLGATGPTTITDNFIDGTYTAGAAANANSDIRIWSQGASISNVTVSGNYLLGGAYTLEVGPGAYTISNVSVTNNYIGFSEFGQYYGTTRTLRPFKETRSSPIRIRPPRPRRLPHTRRPPFCRRM